MLDDLAFAVEAKDVNASSFLAGRTVPIQPYALASSGNIAAAPRTAGLDDRESA
jgi:hypothetical protein